MPKVQKTPGPDSEKDRIKFPARTCVQWDDDVLSLLNQAPIAWQNQRHAINACVRHALQHHAPEGLRLCLSPFEQLVFAKKIKILTEKNDRTGKARK